MKISELKEIAYKAKEDRPRLVVCGGGHVGQCVVKMGQMLDFEVVLIDDREVFANTERFPGVAIICQPFREALEQIVSDEHTYFVLSTRGHATDYQCLEAIIHKPAAYKGMIGSKRKAQLLMEQLRDKGVDERRLKEIHTPIGLNIGAKTPAEISVSIMAQVIQVRSQKGYESCMENELIECILKDEAQVVATIIEQYGSAPRGVGAMLIMKKDGTVVGTVGGGRVEKEVIEKAKEMGEGGEKQYVYYAMNHQSQESEKMICGGAVNVSIDYVEYDPEEGNI